MKITLLKKNPKVYSCNVYLVRGNWNAISDINTLIDVGIDGYIIDELETLSTGVGKRRVEQIVLTHEHFDHTGGLKTLKGLYNPHVIGFSKIDGVDERVYDGMKVCIGDREAEILHTPGHSHDSICVYCRKEGVLFSGDTSLNIKTPGGSYSVEYFEVLERLSKLKITSIYSGHDEPVVENAHEMILNTIRNVKKSGIIK